MHNLIIKMHDLKMNKQELLDELRKEGFSEEIIRAFDKVPREDFISHDLKNLAYENNPLSIGYGATISQPYTIAFMLSLLELRDNLKILEVGSGSGYVLALINELSKNSGVYGIERIKELVERSRKILDNKKNILIFHGDGSKGLENEKPFDRILVSASSEEIPKKLISQLRYGGILIIPVKNSIVSLKKYKGENKITEYPGFVFVPLLKGERE